MTDIFIDLSPVTTAVSGVTTNFSNFAEPHSRKAHETSLRSQERVGSTIVSSLVPSTSTAEVNPCEVPQVAQAVCSFSATHCDSVDNVESELAEMRQLLSQPIRQREDRPSLRIPFKHAQQDLLCEVRQCNGSRKVNKSPDREYFDKILGKQNCSAFDKGLTYGGASSAKHCESLIVTYLKCGKCGENRFIFIDPNANCVKYCPFCGHKQL